MIEIEAVSFEHAAIRIQELPYFDSAAQSLCTLATMAFNHLRIMVAYARYHFIRAQVTQTRHREPVTVFIRLQDQISGTKPTI